MELKHLATLKRNVSISVALLGWRIEQDKIINPFFRKYPKDRKFLFCSIHFALFFEKNPIEIEVKRTVVI